MDSSFRQVVTDLPMVPSESKRDIQAVLNYYKDPGDGSLPVPVYVGRATVANERPVAPTSVIVHDITHDEVTYSLDVHGFQLSKTKTDFLDFESEEHIRKEYYPECERLYKEVCVNDIFKSTTFPFSYMARTNFDRSGASVVHIFGHLVRRGPTHWHKLGRGNARNKGPLHRVHVDQSYDGAELILSKHLPEISKHECGELTRPRWAIVNLWRPLKTIYKDPLAVASAASVHDEDLVEAQVIYTEQSPPYNLNKTWSLLPQSRHDWYYKNEMKHDEVLFIKCFDSAKDGKARRTPHCAFVDEARTGDNWTDRESVEVRAVLIW